VCCKLNTMAQHKLMLELTAVVAVLSVRMRCHARQTCCCMLLTTWCAALTSNSVTPSTATPPMRTCRVAPC
jgi:hypothetical protein